MGRYNGSLTREQFMFNEMRIVARLKQSGRSDAEIAERVERENLFQYPTERELKGKCKVALRRLQYISGSTFLLQTLAEGAVAEAKQAALAAMMCDSRLLAEFMILVVGEKYRLLDGTLTQKDVHLFFARLCEEDDHVKAWSLSTVKRIKSVCMNVLRENGYLGNVGSEALLPVMVSDEFASALKALGMQSFLPAFNVLD